jgi:hypothetical protein
MGLLRCVGAGVAPVCGNPARQGHEKGLQNVLTLMCRAFGVGGAANGQFRSAGSSAVQCRTAYVFYLMLLGLLWFVSVFYLLCDCRFTWWLCLYWSMVQWLSWCHAYIHNVHHTSSLLIIKGPQLEDASPMKLSAYHWSAMLTPSRCGWLCSSQVLRELAEPSMLYRRC